MPGPKKQYKTEEERKARNAAYSHEYRHRSNNLPARTHNRAARLAAQWVQKEHPSVWKRLVREAEQIEAENTTEYTPHSTRYAADTCPHDKIKAVGIMRQCVNCGEFLGAYAVEDPTNQEFLQEILEAEGGA